MISYSVLQVINSSSWNRIEKVLSKNNLSESLEKMLKSEGNIFADVKKWISIFQFSQFFSVFKLTKFLKEMKLLQDEREGPLVN